MILGWAIDTVQKVLTLPYGFREKVVNTLVAITPNDHICSQCRWHRLLGILRTAVLTIATTDDMFTCLHNALKTAKGRNIVLTTPVHDKLNIWRHLVASLSPCMTHLRETCPYPPIYIEVTKTFLEGMIGVCLIPYGEWRIWNLSLCANMCSFLITE